jgi:hypothetical protein
MNKKYLVIDENDLDRIVPAQIFLFKKLCQDLRIVFDADEAYNLRSNQLEYLCLDMKDALELYACYNSLVNAFFDASSVQLEIHFTNDLMSDIQGIFWAIIGADIESNDPMSLELNEYGNRLVDNDVIPTILLIDMY